MSSRGERLAAAIRGRGISKMLVLAHHLDVNESAISRWKQDGAMSLNNAARIAEVLDVSMDWLILGRGEMDIHKTPGLRSREFELIETVRRYPPESVDDLVRFLSRLTPDG